MSFKPLVIDQGQIKQLPAGESIDVGGWTLPASGGSENQFLQADASGNPQWRSSPILAGDLDLKTYKITTSTLDGDIIIEPNGTGALRGSSGGDARGDYATDWQRVRLGVTGVASGYASVIAGGYDNTVSGIYSVVGGGRSNTTSIDYAAVAGGLGNSCQGRASFIGSGWDNSITSNYAVIAGGAKNQITRYYATIPGGLEAWVRHWGQMAHSAGKFVEVGDAQRAVSLLRRTTTSTSQNQLYLNGDDASEGLNLLYGDTWFFTIRILAVKKNSMQNAYAEEIQGIITRASGGTQMVAGPTQVRTLGTSLGTITVDADGTNNLLRIQVTPNTVDEIWWLASVDTVHINGYVA